MADLATLDLDPFFARFLTPPTESLDTRIRFVGSAVRPLDESLDDAESRDDPIMFVACTSRAYRDIRTDIAASGRTDMAVNRDHYTYCGYPVLPVFYSLASNFKLITLSYLALDPMLATVPQ